MAGINISFVSDVRGFLRGTKDIERSMDDVGSSLDDMARDAKSDGRKVENALDDVADQATDSAKTVERKFRDAFDDVRKDAKRAGDDIGDKVRDGTHKAASGMDELKDEAGSTARESAASFTGSADDITDAFQEVAANAFAGFGPAGAAAGLAAAAGIGTLWASIQKGTEETKQRIQDMYDQMLESGADYLTDQNIQENYWALLKDDSSIAGLEELKRVADNASLTLEEVALAYAGNTDMMTRATQGLIDRRAIFEAQLVDEDDMNQSAAQSGITYVNGMIEALQRRTDEIGRSTAGVNNGRAAWEMWGRSSTDAARLSQEGIGRAHDAYTGLGDDIRRMPQPVIRPTVDTADAEQRMVTFLSKRRVATVDIVQRPGMAV